MSFYQNRLLTTKYQHSAMCEFGINIDNCVTAYGHCAMRMYNIFFKKKLQFKFTLFKLFVHLSREVNLVL